MATAIKLTFAIVGQQKTKEVEIRRELMIVMRDAGPPAIASLMPLDTFSEGLLGMLCDDTAIDDFILTIMGELVGGGHFDPLANKRFFEYT